MSKDFFDHLIEKNGLMKDFEENGLMERERILIKELISGKGTTLSQDKRFLYQIVANKDNDIDVDKWDYFLRDGLQLNLKITFDYNRMLQFCCIVKDEKGNNVIGYRNKESNNLWDMFRVRADLHHRAYQHRVSKNIDIMYIDAFVEANKVYKFVVENEVMALSDVHNHMNAFAYLTDHVIYNILCDPNPELEAAKHIFRRILNRHLYTHIGTYNVELELDKNIKTDTIKSKLEAYFENRYRPHVLKFAVNKSDEERHINSFKKVIVFNKCPTSWPLKGKQIDLSEVSGPYPVPQQNPRKKMFIVFVFCQTYELSSDEKERIEEDFKHELQVNKDNVFKYENGITDDVVMN